MINYEKKKKKKKGISKTDKNYKINELFNENNDLKKKFNEKILEIEKNLSNFEKEKKKYQDNLILVI